MNRWHYIILGILLLIPPAFFAVIGTIALWHSGQFVYFWWVFPICWLLACLLNRLWQTRERRIESRDRENEPHWTPRDEAAQKHVEEKQLQVKEIDAESLIDPHFYLQTGMDLAEEISRHYHPQAEDPISNLTLPEIVAAVHLAIEDVEVWINDYVPGSHLLTLKQWKGLTKAPKWYRRASNVGWAASILLNPANITRYLTSRLAMTPLTKYVQEDLLVAFYMMFVRQVGFYLIEMNSGRLKKGSVRYREIMGQLKRKDDDAEEPPVSSIETRIDRRTGKLSNLTIAIVGQESLGRSACLASLTGASTGRPKRLWKTKAVYRHVLQQVEIARELTILETPSYGTDGKIPDKMKRDLNIATEHADLILLVVQEEQTHFDSDVEFLTQFDTGFGEKKHRLPPPILCVMSCSVAGTSKSEMFDEETEGTLSRNEQDDSAGKLQAQPSGDNAEHPPLMEDHEFLTAHLEQRKMEIAMALGGRMKNILTIEVDPDTNRLAEWETQLMPGIKSIIQEARASSVTRTFEKEPSRRRVKDVMKQLRNLGSVTFKSLFRKSR